MRAGSKFVASVVAAVGVIVSISTALAADTGATGGSQQLTIVNNLPVSAVCPNGNTLTVFPPNQPQTNIDPKGGTATFSGDFSTAAGIGIQVNNWYWVATKSPVSAGGNGAVQNPDNSGAQFVISSDCQLKQESPAWFGKGIQSYLIADFKVAKNADGQCVVTVTPINYTNAVTPECCSPPGDYSNICKSDQWGKTQNGLAWPPPGS